MVLLIHHDVLKDHRIRDGFCKTDPDGFMRHPYPDSSECGKKIAFILQNEYEFVFFFSRCIYEYGMKNMIEYKY